MCMKYIISNKNKYVNLIYYEYANFWSQQDIKHASIFLKHLPLTFPTSENWLIAEWWDAFPHCRKIYKLSSRLERILEKHLFLFPSNFAQHNNTNKKKIQSIPTKNNKKNRALENRARIGRITMFIRSPLYPHPESYILSYFIL